MARFERFIIYPLLLLCLLYMAIDKDPLSARDSEVYYESIVADKITASMITADDITIKEELLALGSIVTLKELILLNEEGQRMVILSINAEAGGSLEIFNQEGRRAADLSTFNQSGLLMLSNGEGEIILRLGEDREGHGLIGVFDREGGSPSYYGHQRRED